MLFKLPGDRRLGRCATEWCGGQPVYRLEAAGVGSDYCSGCSARIRVSNHAPSALDDTITSIIRDVAELPDRTSPGDDTETMLVRESELRDILWRHLEGWGPSR